jgi:anti-anti-sigma regulatory factor
MQVWVNGHEHADFDAEALTVTLPHSLEPQDVRVRLVSASCTFSADTLDVSGGIARITLAGALSAQRLGVLREQLEGALDGGARTVVLEADDLVYLDPEAVRYLAMAKQHRDFRLAVTGAHGQVAEELVASELNEELAAVGDPR